jgi:hypothetical protein
MPAAARPYETASGAHAGWIAGVVVILGVLVVGAAFWFLHHP